MSAEEKLKIIQDTPNKYHFKTKDDQRVNIEHKDDDFIYLSLYKWGEEALLQIILDAVPVPNHTFSENKIEVENPDFVLRVYPIDTRTTGEFYGDSEDMVQCHDGGIRFELVLKKKRPAMGNTISFPLVTKNLRFSYQSFLTLEQIENDIKRPLNVEGSYAIYHITKKNNQYITGKAFHIYRPIAEDALGNKAWCALSFDKYINPTSLTLTIPQQFLDEAVYPITIDPDFGYTTIGGSSGNIATPGAGGSRRRGSAWTMPAPGGTANFIKARIFGDDVCDCRVWINQKDSVAADQHGQIATAENLSCAVAEHWEEFTLAGETLTEAVVYILNIAGNEADMGKGEAYYVRYDENGCVDSYFEGFSYATPESPWIDSPDVTTLDYSIYCDYTAAAAGWTGKISGVTDPAKVMGVEVANIVKVKGVE